MTAIKKRFVSYRAKLLPAQIDVGDVVGRLKLVWEAVPDPVLVVLALTLVLEQVAVDVDALIAGAVGEALEQIHGSGAGHANVDGGVNFLATVPKGGDQLAHRLVVDSNGLGMHEDAHGGQGGGLVAGSGVRVLGAQRRQMRRQTAGDFP